MKVDMFFFYKMFNFEIWKEKIYVVGFMFGYDEFRYFIVVMNGDCGFNKSGIVFVESDVLLLIIKLIKCSVLLILYKR